MRNKIYRAMAILGILTAFAVVGVQAQAPSRVEVKIPFEFSAGKSTLKAGVYSIKRMSGNLVSLRNVADKSSVILNAPVSLSTTDPNAVERLVFNKDGDRYALAQIWLTADSGRELLKKTKTANGERLEIALQVPKLVE